MTSAYDGDSGPTRGWPSTEAFQPAWTAATSIVVLVSLAAAVYNLGPLSSLAVFATVSFLVWLCLFVGTSDTSEPGFDLVRWAWGIGAGVTAVAGLATLIGGWSLAVWFVVAISCPRLIVWARLPDTPAGEQSTAKEKQAERISLNVPPVDLDDAALCAMWRDTGRVLARPLSTSTTLRVVEYRAACLDEIERRFPDAITDWLDHGPPLGVNPRTYLPPGLRSRRTS